MRTFHFLVVGSEPNFSRKILASAAASTAVGIRKMQLEQKKIFEDLIDKKLYNAYCRPAGVEHQFLL